MLHRENISESVLQKLVLAHLLKLREELRYECYFWRANTGAAVRRGGGMVRFGPPGQADILGCVRSRFVAIELKSKDGRLNDDQKKFRSDVEAAGGLYVVARTLDEALAPVKRMFAETDLL